MFESRLNDFNIEFNCLAVLRLISTKSALAHPRLSASIPSIPVPAYKSNMLALVLISSLIKEAIFFPSIIVAIKLLFNF